MNLPSEGFSQPVLPSAAVEKRTVMHFNIVLLPKKVTNYVTFIMESNALRYFCITFTLLFK